MPEPRKISNAIHALAWIQGVYFVITGIWPLVNMNSFLAVTGPKHDLWLVQTVGGLIAVIGLTLCAAASRRIVHAEAIVLAIASAAALILVDTIFTAEQIIPPIYLLDAVAEILLIIAWAILIVAMIGHRREHRPRRQHLATAWH